MNAKRIFESGQLQALCYMPIEDHDRGLQSYIVAATGNRIRVYESENDKLNELYYFECAEQPTALDYLLIPNSKAYQTLPRSLLIVKGKYNLVAYQLTREDATLVYSVMLTDSYDYSPFDKRAFSFTTDTEHSVVVLMNRTIITMVTARKPSERSPIESYISPSNIGSGQSSSSNCCYLLIKKISVHPIYTDCIFVPTLESDIKLTHMVPDFPTLQIRKVTRDRYTITLRAVLGHGKGNDLYPGIVSWDFSMEKATSLTASKDARVSSTSLSEGIGKLSPMYTPFDHPEETHHTIFMKTVGSDIESTELLVLRYVAKPHLFCFRINENLQHTVEVLPIRADEEYAREVNIYSAIYIKGFDAYFLIMNSGAVYSGIVTEIKDSASKILQIHRMNITLPPCSYIMHLKGNRIITYDDMTGCIRLGTLDPRSKRFLLGPSSSPHFSIAQILPKSEIFCHDYLASCNVENRSMIAQFSLGLTLDSRHLLPLDSGLIVKSSFLQLNHAFLWVFADGTVGLSDLIFSAESGTLFDNIVPTHVKFRVPIGNSFDRTLAYSEMSKGKVAFACHSSLRICDPALQLEAISSYEIDHEYGGVSYLHTVGGFLIVSTSSAFLVFDCNLELQHFVEKSTTVNVIDVMIFNASLYVIVWNRNTAEFTVHNASKWHEALAAAPIHRSEIGCFTTLATGIVLLGFDDGGFRVLDWSNSALTNKIEVFELESIGTKRVCEIQSWHASLEITADERLYITSTMRQSPTEFMVLVSYANEDVMMCIRRNGDFKKYIITSRKPLNHKRESKYFPLYVPGSSLKMKTIKQSRKLCASCICLEGYSESMICYIWDEPTIFLRRTLPMDFHIRDIQFLDKKRSTLVVFAKRCVERECIGEVLPYVRGLFCFLVDANSLNILQAIVWRSKDRRISPYRLFVPEIFDRSCTEMEGVLLCFEKLEDFTPSAEEIEQAQWEQLFYKNASKESCSFKNKFLNLDYTNQHCENKAFYQNDGDCSYITIKTLSKRVSLDKYLILISSASGAHMRGGVSLWHFPPIKFCDFHPNHSWNCFGVASKLIIEKNIGKKARFGKRMDFALSKRFNQSYTWDSDFTKKPSRWFIGKLNENFWLIEGEKGRGIATCAQKALNHEFLFRIDATFSGKHEDYAKFLLRLGPYYRIIISDHGRLSICDLTKATPTFKVLQKPFDDLPFESSHISSANLVEMTSLNKFTILISAGDGDLYLYSRA
ncbi:hypothetical protein CANCADRAFT_3645 [Tortispora caseinolytica NRRL Y-17796]|uniref:Uncharacterized protein n=1 Tax=Tortispora caseinolytica NRRL Y-17796 TaxID=767744 RepID=A0A1E4TB51_9ASCO|nr:hypothetical protein CANCADRAFT_3645 [Tortispora caseinolytica NRRL Y-17796]